MALKQRVITTVVRQFGHPRGLAGRAAGWVMAHRRSNRQRNTWVVSLLDVQPTDRVLEVGFAAGDTILTNTPKRVPGVRAWSASECHHERRHPPGREFLLISSRNVTARALDGLRLVGTLVVPDIPADRAVVLLHGGGVTREEGGFFTRLAAGLAEAGVASARFDLRGHGESEGKQEERTLTAHLNDIRVTLDEARELTGATTLSLLGASFGGGLCAYYAAKRPDELTRLVLLNPQLQYKERYVYRKPHWQNDRLDDEAVRHLRDTGYIRHSPTVKHGRAFLNEVFWISPNAVLGEITAPTLIVHGTKDTFVPIESSRAAVTQLTAKHELVEIDGAQHGFAVHDDPLYANPQSQEWQAHVIRTVARWLSAAESPSSTA